MHIVYVGNELSKWGYTPTSIEVLGDRFLEIGEVYKYSNKKNKGIRFIHMLVGVWKHRKAADLVIIDTYSNSAFYYTVFTAMLCKWFQLPFIPILHGGSLHEALKKHSVLSKWTFGKAFRLVAPSRYLHDAFVASGYKNITIVPNFIDIGHYTFTKRITIRPKLLWVRSFHELYNPNLAVDLLVGIKYKYPDAVLCMVGPDKDGAMAKFKQYAQEKGVLTSIEITGKLSKNEWITRASEYDIFLNTTNFDNTPVSVIEAMALGMVVVSTNAGGVPALIEHGMHGILFPCGNVRLGIEALERALAPGNGEILSVNARSRAESWDWSEVKEQWKQLFEEVKNLD